MSHDPSRPMPHLGELIEAAQSRAPVSLGRRRTSSTHEFYRYPARFSPEIARSVIRLFSEEADLVLDPFVGGGTTAVEAMLAGRRSIAADLNPLATFVTRVKTNPMSAQQRAEALAWVEAAPDRLMLNRPPPPLGTWSEEGYLVHLNNQSTWRIARLIAFALDSIRELESEVQDFCRCVILRTAQWALDMRREIPSVSEFRSALVDHGRDMVQALANFADELSESVHQPTILEIGLPRLAAAVNAMDTSPPRLILTSPPYPGVYVNYHRWKLQGRKEIRAPYWIAEQRDGHGLAHYTMSARAEPTLTKYFSKLLTAYRSLAFVADSRTLLVQVVGFNDREDQLPRFLHTMEEAGFDEITFPEVATADDGRLWRAVPGRRWWTKASAKRGVAPHTAREVILFYRLARTLDILQ